MTPLERDIEQKLRKKVEACGGKCLKWVCPGWSGVPDRIVLLPGGRVIFVETKRPKGGKLSKLQKWWAKTLIDLDFSHWVLWDFEELELFEEAELTEVRWMHPGQCPVTPEQFEAIYNDDEDLGP